mmetsp:Transcript_22173/g.32735  ORF Transcript_22173/g.32735 Transcript_22173/m.32735 type:complete len:83 (+) Transcript_22173:519-767(+)
MFIVRGKKFETDKIKFENEIFEISNSKMFYHGKESADTLTRHTQRIGPIPFHQCEKYLYSGELVECYCLMHIQWTKLYDSLN